MDASAAPFAWRAVPGAQRYHLQVGTTPAFDGDVLDVDAGDTAELTLFGTLPVREQELFWRVRAETADGTTAWSGYGRFRAATDDDVDAYRAETEAAEADAAKAAVREREAREAELDLIPHYEREESVTTVGEVSAIAVMLVTFVLTVVLLWVMTS